MPKTKINSPQSMDDLLKQEGYDLRGLKKGEFIVGTIAEKRGKTVYIDIGAKTEGIITGKELLKVKDFVSQLEVSDQVEVQVRVPENDRGQTLLSLRKAAGNFAWGFFEKRLKTKKEVEVHGREGSHGGLVVVGPFNLLGFIPGSQIGSKYNQDPNQMIGKKIKVQVLEVDREKNRLVFSERLISEPKAVQEEKELIESVKEGNKFGAKIVRVEPFGLFIQVSVKNKLIEGLVHISEVSWEKVDNLPYLYKSGDKVEVVLLNKENNRLQFSIKKLTPDPWGKIEKKYPINKEIKGKIVRLANFGALVRLEPGIEGLIHISKIPPEAKLEIDQKVHCYVESLDIGTRKLSLGLVLTGKKLPIYK